MLKSDQVSKIEIAGYKSLKQCSVTLNKVNVLIGSNGAGKSNFISAFTMLQNILNKNLQVYAAECGLNSLFYNGRKDTDHIDFEVFFGNHSYGFTLVPTDDHRLIFREEHFASHEREEKRIDLSRGHGESVWDAGGDQLDPQIIPILQKQAWRVYHFHDTSRAAKVKQSHNLSNCRSLQLDAGNLAAFLFRLKHSFPREYRDIVETVKLVAPYFEDFVLEPEVLNPELITLRWKQRGCEDVFNASQLSDGTLRFICLATLLLQPGILQPETIIIDEPELGLHPYAIRIFGEMVGQVSEEKQIIISTQSAELLNEFDTTDILVVDKSAEGSVFRRLKEDELQAWLEEDYTIGELWKKNLFGGRP